MKTRRTAIHWFVLLIVMVTTELGINESLAGPRNSIHSTSLASAEKLDYDLEKSTEDKMGREGTMELNLQEFIRLVRKKNEQILFQDSQWAISREAVRSAKAIFEPAFIGSYQHDEDKRRNTIQELVSQGFIPEFHERRDNYQAAVEGLVPTGGRLRLGYSMRDFSNSINERYGANRESQTVFGASFTQPLLKDGGIKPTTAGIRVAEAEADIAFHTFREQMMRVISEATATYWDLALAQEKYKVRRESERNAEEILRDNIVRFKTGKMAETEVLEAQAALDIRRSLVSEAKQTILATMNSLRTFFSSSAAETKAEITLSDQLYREEIKPDFSDSLAKALKLRPEYQSSRKKIEREDIRLVYAQNQRWPQLDLKGSYSLNGLADAPRDSWNEAVGHDFETWYLGLELRIPLGGDRKSKSELEATRQRKRQALLELKSVEVALANTLNTAIQSVLSTQDQVRHYTSAVDIKKRLLEVELERFRSGKSNSRILLEKEEDLNKAKEAEIESLLKYRKALLHLTLAEGSLLVHHDIEIMEVNS